MKKILLALIFLIGMFSTGFSQGTAIYTVFVNIVPEEFNMPLIGFVNIAKGNHSMPQIGFVNWNTGDFSSLQMGFVNTTGNNSNGVQFGFLNTSAGDKDGVQFGFLNTVARSAEGFQFGFVNAVANDTKGLQFGFVNTSAGDIKGMQFGFVNAATKSGEGFQCGFINTATHKLAGVQLGFLNHADSVENGIPIGLFSIVRHGGYRAFEYSFSEFFPLNIQFKLGVEKFYTNFIVAYNSFNEIDPKQIITGLGIGSIFSLSNYLFINPELNSLYSLFSDENNLWLSLTPFFGFNINKNFSITLGPSITWLHAFSNTELQKPSFNIMENIIDENNNIVIGAKACVRFRF